MELCVWDLRFVLLNQYFTFKQADNNAQVPMHGLCSRLARVGIVGGNYPFVKDTCNDNLYQLLDGFLFQGTGQYPLIEYNAMYDGALLHVFN